MEKAKGAITERIGYLQVIGAAMVWGSYGLFVRALDCSPLYILAHRFLFGFIGLLIFFSLTRGLASLKPALSHWKWMLLPALVTAFSWLAYTYALANTSVANAVFLVYTAPVYTVFFAPIFLGEKLEARTVAALAISLLGTGAIIGYSSLFSAGSNLPGDLAAIFGGITYGFLTLVLKRAPTAVLGLPSSFLVTGLIALAMLPYVLLSFNQFHWQTMLLLLGLGLTQQTLGSTLFHLGLRSVKAQHVGIMTYIEPLAATLMAALFLYEALTWGAIVGGFLIITGGMMVVLRKKALT